MNPKKQGASEDQQPWKGRHGFAKPVDTKKGYYVTGADIKAKRHTLRVFIKCRDLDTLDQYIDNVKIAFALQPLAAIAAQSIAALFPGEKGTIDQSSSANLSADHENPPTLEIHLRLKNVSKRKPPANLHVAIDPPIPRGRTHLYHFPSSSRANITVTAEGGSIDATFSCSRGRDPNVPIVPFHGVAFDDPNPFQNRLIELRATDDGTMYTISGDFQRPDPDIEAEEVNDDRLFLGAS